MFLYFIESCQPSWDPDWPFQTHKQAGLVQSNIYLFSLNFTSEYRHFKEIKGKTE